MFKNKACIPFILGCLFGLILLLAGLYMSFDLRLPKLVVSIIALPAMMSSLIARAPVAIFCTFVGMTDICDNISFDSGGLKVFEMVFVSAGTILIYGFIFLGVYKMYQTWKRN